MVEPNPLTSRMTLKVRFCETDLMGIVHHANYLVYFEAGRVDWLHRRGVAYEDWAARGIHLPVVETRLRYRKAARFNDVLTIESTMLELRRATVRYGYRIMREPDFSSVLCEGETLLACVGPEFTPIRVPEDIAQVLRSPES